MLLKGKIPQYVNKQFNAINQKLTPSDFMSLKFTFSISPSLIEVSSLSHFAAILSITIIPIPELNETQHTMNPTNRAVPSPALSAIGGSIKLLKTDPSLENVMFNPRAKASSFPKNHLLTTTVWTTFKLSPPSPNTTLPIKAMRNPVSPATKPPIVNIPCPSVRRV